MGASRLEGTLPYNGGCVSTANQPTTEIREIPREVDRQDKIISELAHSVDILETRLSIICAPPIPLNVAKSDRPDNLSDLARVLQVNNENLLVVIERIQSIVKRLEI